MKIPFIGPTYQARSLKADAQRALNVYLETDPVSPRGPAVLYGRPGMETRFTLASAGVRGAITVGEVSYFVSGNAVYRVTTGYAATLMGTIGTTSGPVSLATNGQQVLIVDGLNGWLASLTGFAQITDVDFPNGVKSATCIAGFFVVTGDGSGQFYWNEVPNVGANWNGLDFASAEGSPDDTVACLANHLELILIGSKTTEIWVLTGDADAPFIRSGNTFIQVGTPAGQTLAGLDNTFFWLGQDENGSGMVWRANGYSPQRISTHAVERVLQTYTNLSDAIAMTMQIEGHAFYVLTFPTDDHTWVYDVATGQWFEWLWRDPLTNVDHRWRPNCHVFFNGEHLVGDWETGEVYALDLDVYTDDGNPIRYLRATQCIDNEDGFYNFYDFLTVDMDAGVGLATGQGSAPLLSMRWSNDGGNTWSNPLTVSMGAAGEYSARARFTQLGQGRNRVWEVSCTDPVKFALIGAYSKFRKGFS